MTLADFSLDGSVAVVTGASRGIVRAIAVTMAEAGADVVAVGRDLEMLQETAAGVEEHGRRCEPLTADVTRGSDLRSVVARTVEVLGTIDILVNNAGVDRQGPVVKWDGIPGVSHHWDELDEESWDLVQATNLRSVFLACQAAGPVMLGRGVAASSTLRRSRGARPGRAPWATRPMPPVRPA
jgi:2-dehydro-3-deoxy-D-gluconate 5-dehydrogenase